MSVSTTKLDRQTDKNVKLSGFSLSQIRKKRCVLLEPRICMSVRFPLKIFFIFVSKYKKICSSMNFKVLYMKLELSKWF